MTKWQLKPRVKKRTHYAKCDVFGFGSFFIFFYSFDQKKKKRKEKKKRKKEHIMLNEKRDAKLMHENMQ